MRTFGFEEEFFIADPITGLPCAPSVSAGAELLSLAVGGTRTVGEFLACQLESNSPICSNRTEALDAARTYRRSLGVMARDMGVRVVALGTPPRIANTPGIVSASDRSHAIDRLCGGIASEHYLSGLHIHVGVEDAETGIIALNGLRRWLPILTACGSNSPYWRGRDTGFASWRTIHYRRWAIQGIQPHFVDAADYEQMMRFMLESDVVLDAGHVNWGARLSVRYPTVEVRVADTQMLASTSVLLALVTRALVDAALTDTRPGVPPMSREAVDLAQWQAAKFGLRGNQLDSLGGNKTSATGMLDKLMAHIRSALERNGDFDYVSAGLARVLQHGTGASIQRAGYRQGGFEAVLDEAEKSMLA